MPVHSVRHLSGGGPGQSIPWLHSGTSEREQGWVLHPPLRGKRALWHMSCLCKSRDLTNPHSGSGGVSGVPLRLPLTPPLGFDQRSQIT